MRLPARPVRPMYEWPKPWWKSRTVWAGLAPILLELVDWLAPAVGLEPVSDGLRTAVLAVSAGGVWYGRAQAQGPLRDGNPDKGTR